MDHDLPAYMRRIRPSTARRSCSSPTTTSWTASAAGGVARRPDRGPLGALHALPLARRQAARLRRPRRAASRGLCHGRRGRPGAAPHLARAPTRWCAAGRRTGEIVYVTTQGQPFFRNHHAFVISPDGGTPRPLPWGQINHLAFGPGERKVIGRNTADPARWKRYRGGTAGTLWIDAEGDGSFRRMKRAARQHSPARCGSPAASGSSATATASATSTPAGRTAASCAGTPTTRRSTPAMRRPTVSASSTSAARRSACSTRRATATRELDIRTPAHRAQAARKFVAAGEHLESFHLHPAGHSLALDRPRPAVRHGALGRRARASYAGDRRPAACAMASGSPTAAPWSR